MAFRESSYIDFDTGVVRKAPMDLVRELKEPHSFDDRLNLFECRVDVWHFGPAVEILKQIERHAPNSGSAWEHAAFALLAIGFAYFEMLGKTLNPNSRITNTAGHDFDSGFWDVYPEFRADVQDTHGFRDRVRNGLYHLAFTKRGLLIHNDYEITRDDFFVDKSGFPPTYYVNPHGMVRKTVAHFPSFSTRLRGSGPEGEALREQFVRFLDDYHDP